jgi:MFS family permease
MGDWRWLVLLCVSRVGFALIFTAYSAVLPLLIPAWDMSAAQAGLVQSGWHAGYLLSLFAAGLLTDRIGARTTFLAMSLCACASAALFALCASDFWSGLGLYFLAGLSSGGSYTPALSLIAQRFPAARRGTAMGWYLAAASFGYALSLFACGALAPWAGWRAGLVLAAAATFAGALIGWIALRDAPPVTPRASSVASWTVSARKLWRNKPAQLAIWAYSFHAWELLGLWAWLPAFLVIAAAQDGGLSRGTIALGGVLAGLTHLVAVLGSVGGGALADRIGRTRVILAMSCASLACSFSFGWLLGGPLWLVASVAVLYNLTAIADSAIFSTVLTEIVPQEYVGVAFSMRSVLGFGMGALSPWVFGLVLDGSGGGTAGPAAWGFAWASLGAGALLGPLLTLRLHARLAGKNA